MFKVLMYYSAYNKLVEIVANMKKIGIDVDSHQSPTQVLSQSIEFNADFIIMESGKKIDEVYRISEKIQHLLSPPKILLIKGEQEILDSNRVMKANISKVFSEPDFQNSLMAYMLEVKGHDPVEVFSKYLKIDYKPKKTITAKKISIDKKFSERNYLSSFTEILDEVESDNSKTLSSAKIDEFKANAQPIILDDTEDSERERFMKALLMGKPTD